MNAALGRIKSSSTQSFELMIRVMVAGNLYHGTASLSSSLDFETSNRIKNYETTEVYLKSLPSNTLDDYKAQD